MPGFDYYIVSKNDPSADTIGSFSFGVASGSPTQIVGIGGFYKGITQFLKALMTQVGSDLSDLTYGTPLASAIGNGIDLATAQDLAVTSVATAFSIVQANQAAAGADPTESLAAVSVTNILQAADSMNLYLTVTNQAGTVLTLALPTGIILPAQD